MSDEMQSDRRVVGRWLATPDDPFYVTPPTPAEAARVTAGLGPTDGGSLTVDRNALVERWAETFGLDLASPMEGALVVQEVGHVARLVEAAVEAERKRFERDLEVLVAVGRMYLDALDDDPEHETLTLIEAWRVTEVRDAVERWEQR